MSNFDKAVEIIGELATEYGQPGGDELFGLDEDAALALKEDGLLAPDVQIIRTVEELEELDLDTLLIDNEAQVRDQWSWFADFTMGNGGIFPLAIIATGEQARAVRKAMEEENE